MGKPKPNTMTAYAIWNTQDGKSQLNSGMKYDIDTIKIKCGCTFISVYYMTVGSFIFLGKNSVIFFSTRAEWRWTSLFLIPLTLFFFCDLWFKKKRFDQHRGICAYVPSFCSLFTFIYRIISSRVIAPSGQKQELQQARIEIHWGANHAAPFSLDQCFLWRGSQGHFF